MAGGNGGRRRINKKNPTHGSSSSRSNQSSFKHQESSTKAASRKNPHSHFHSTPFRYTYPEKQEEKEEESMDEMDCLDPDSTPVINKDRFLMIGGVRVYPENTSSSDCDGKSSERLSCSDESNSSDAEEDDDDDDDSDLDSGSDIDEELAKDYLDGIGGSSELLNAQWLATVKLDEFGKEGLMGSDGRDKLGAIALMNASKEYGLRKPCSMKGKGLEDLLFVKDSRITGGKRKQKRQSPLLSRSWPVEAQNRRTYDKFSGGQKKHHKELIAMKRRQRMINRGVDLEEINKNLREMVIKDIDVFSFQPMHSRDCSQVQRLASIYALRSGCQSSGKKRFVTVTRTERTCLPSSREKDRLDKLLQVGTEDEDFAVCSGNMAKEATKEERRHSSTPGSKARSRSESHRRGENHGSKKKQNAPQSYAEKPVSFVSCGVMQVDSAAELVPLDSTECQPLVEKDAEASSSKLGSFEMHTKGFGSRMLAKMGFIEGSGLGKSGQGMVQPIEAIKRPKSLGLGAGFAEFAESATEEVRVEKAAEIGAFEKHTKGFGSKMMLKMGFNSGSGLGKDAQGMTTPLTAVWRPRSRGLGAT